LIKKIKIADDNLLLLEYMISMEIRYQYNMDKLPTYYKAKSIQCIRKYDSDVANDISQKELILNT
jgi:hypothetical protein